MVTQRSHRQPVAAPEEQQRQLLRAISKLWPKWGLRRAEPVL